MATLKHLFPLLALFALAQCLYEPGSKVVSLTNKNFKSEVLQSDEFWLVEFYAPWCGHCKHAAPQYEKAAEILEGIVNVGAVDMTTDGEVGRPYDVNSYPTIKFFGVNKKQPIDFNSSDRVFEKFVNFCLGKSKTEILARIEQIKQRPEYPGQEQEL